MKGFKITDVDKGYKKRVAELTTKGQPYVKVGVFGANADKSYDDGTTVGDVATFHEFGLGVPERSFIRSWADENQDKVKAFIKEQKAKGTSDDQTLERVGLLAVGGIQEKIASNIPPPLAASTIARKGSSTALIDTGQLRASISYEVVLGKE